MNNAIHRNEMCYVAWILGQTSALLGAILVVMWAFGLALIVARIDYATATGATPALLDAWRPPVGPPMAGLGIAILGWLASHLRKLGPPTPVVLGVLLNLLALAIAMVSSAY